MKFRVISFLSRFWKVFKNSFSGFLNDNAIKLSASLSYYTIFSLPPLVLIITSYMGYFFGREAIQGKVYGQISGLVGSTAALEIQNIIKNIHLSNDTYLATIIGIIMLVIGATGVFIEIQDSINTIWGIKVKPKKGFLKLIMNRLISLSMIAAIGFLLLVSLLVNTVLDVVSTRLQNYFTTLTVSFFYVVNIALVFCVITALFTIIFKVLPDGKVKLRDAIKGASFTAVLFMAGKFAISYYLGMSSVTTVYGAAGSVILLILWVYYSSIILFFGAEFTKIYAINYGGKIIPNDYAVRVIVKEVEKSGPPPVAHLA
jgi:membrane protein